MEWNDELLEIYQRQILLKDVGIEGMQRVLESKILVIGVGAIGCSVLQYLAASGVGEIGILGDATIERADISTQILYNLKDVGKSKLSVLKSRLKTINPRLKVRTHKDSISSENFETLVKIMQHYDIVLDCADSFAPKMLINAACVRSLATLVSGGISDMSLQVLSVKAGESACYSCVFGVSKGFLESLAKGVTYGEVASKNAAPTCAKSAMIGSVAGILGSIMVTEVIKILCDIKTPLFNTFLTFHTREMTLTRETIQRNPKCPICADSIK